MKLKLNFWKAFWVDYYLLKYLMQGFSFLVACILIFYHFFIAKNINIESIFDNEISIILSNKLFYIFIIIALGFIVGIFFIVLFFKRLSFLKSFETDSIIVQGLVKNKIQHTGFRTKTDSYIVELEYMIDNNKYNNSLKLLINGETDCIKANNTLSLAVKKSSPKNLIILDLYFYND